METSTHFKVMLRRATFFAMALFLLCFSTVSTAESRSTQNLNAIADDYFWTLQDRLLRPNLSSRANSAWVGKLEGFEQRVNRIKTSNLDQQSRITFRMLTAELKNQKQHVKKGWILEDINGSESLLHTIVGGIDAVERKNTNDWKWTIKTLRNSTSFVNNYISLLQDGLKQGRVRSRPVVESSIRSLKILTGNSQRNNPFLALKAELEQSMAGRKQLPALRKELDRVLSREVIPAHTRLMKFVKTDYLPRAPKLGKNRQRYLHHMAEHLGEKHPSPESLNRWGHKEVARLLRELDRTVKTINPRARSTATFMSGLNRRKSNRYSSGQELIDSTIKEIKHTQKLARKMVPVPASKVKVERVAPYQEATLAAQYMEAGHRTGVMQVNTGKLLKGQRKYDLATLVTHEVFGGHHLAAMYAQKQTRLPAYRQGSANTAYDEGWALYSEQWRDVQGKFTPNERIGYLVNHLWRAARLVVDTGLHTGTMTPTQATRYFQRNTFTSSDNAKAEIERYINWPGQALAYYHGKRQLLGIKRDVKKILGRSFDAKRFHAKLLNLGSVPLSEARTVLTSWANRRKAQVGRPPRAPRVYRSGRSKVSTSRTRISRTLARR